MTLRIVPAIHRATHAIALMLEQSTDLGVTQAEAHVLSYLAGRREATIGEIHGAFGHKRSTLTSVLDRLEARDLITREVNVQDRRSFVVSLTRQGSSLASTVLAQLERLEAEVFKHFARSELEAFDDVVATVAELAVDEKVAARGRTRLD